SCRRDPGASRTHVMKTLTAAPSSIARSPVAMVLRSWPRRIAEQRALWNLFARLWYVYLPLLFFYLWALDHIGVNWTPSLPYHVNGLVRRDQIIGKATVIF